MPRACSKYMLDVPAYSLLYRFLVEISEREFIVLAAIFWAGRVFLIKRSND